MNPEGKQLGISLKDILPDSVPVTGFMSQLSLTELNDLIKVLNDKDVRIHLFKFVHDLHMFFGRELCGFNEVKE